MFENNYECISNCLNTQLGTHIMYRDFGLNVIDESNPPLRKDIQLQLSMYYPTISIMSMPVISIKDELMKGQFKYNITLVGE